MSTKELCIQLLHRVPDYKMGYVLAFLQGLTIDEDADDAFCEKLVKNYLDDPGSDKNEFVTLEELAAQEGITL